MNLNAALVLTLLLCSVAATLGFWLGRRSRKHTTRQHRTGTAVARAKVKTGDSRPAQSAKPSTVASPLSARTPDRLRQQIDDKLDQLRRARENAEPWPAPAVDRLPAAWRTDLPTRPMVFADTTIDPQAMH